LQVYKIKNNLINYMHKTIGDIPLNLGPSLHETAPGCSLTHFLQKDLSLDNTFSLKNPKKFSYLPTNYLSNYWNFLLLTVPWEI